MASRNRCPRVQSRGTGSLKCEREAKHGSTNEGKHHGEYGDSQIEMRFTKKWNSRRSESYEDRKQRARNGEAHNRSSE